MRRVPPGSTDKRQANGKVLSEYKGKVGRSVSKINWNKDRIRKQMHESRAERISRDKHIKALKHQKTLKKSVPDWILEKRKHAPKGMTFCANNYCTTLLNKFKKGIYCDFHGGLRGR